MANTLNANDQYGDYSDEQLATLPGAPKRGANGGYVYGWRQGAYTDVLGDNDVAQQQQLQTFRNEGGKVAEDDVTAGKQMRGELPVSQQWTQQANSGTGGGNNSGRQNELFDLLMERIKQPRTPDKNDPVIRGQADAYSAQQTRASKNYLADMAEGNSPYFNMGGEERLAAERVGQNSGQFEAELIGREQDARRAEITQSLEMYGSQFTEQERQALQMELAQMDIGERRAGRFMQDDQFKRRLALDEWNYGNQDDYRRRGI